MTRDLQFTLGVLTCLLSVSSPARAQWQLNGTFLGSPYSQDMLPRIAPDGAGGAIVTWWAGPSGNEDIYVQRIDDDGYVLWAPGGVALCNAPGDQNQAIIVSDGAGGAIVTWVDARDGTRDIYAQRVNASGVAQWTPSNGVGLCVVAGSDQYDPAILSDDAGGAWVAWDDGRLGVRYIAAQHVTSSGTTLMVTNGARICQTPDPQYTPALASDGTGGMIAVWNDYRFNLFNDIYGTRLNSDGVVTWISTGAPICTATQGQFFPRVVPDGAGGAIVP